jgi:hypothetical protein
MKFRLDKGSPSETDVSALASEVRALDATPPESSRAASPPDPYWQNLPVRVNKRIDEATSGVALSISWAARVAIPGVMVILSFLLALQYYVPKPQGVDSLGGVVSAMQATVLDSLFVMADHQDEGMLAEVVTGDLMAVTRTQAADYLLSSGASTAVMESLSDEQLQEVITRVGAPGGQPASTR